MTTSKLARRVYWMRWVIGVSALAFLVLSECQVARLVQGDVAPRISVAGATCNLPGAANCFNMGQ